MLHEVDLMEGLIDMTLGMLDEEEDQAREDEQRDIAGQIADATGRRFVIDVDEPADDHIDLEDHDQRECDQAVTGGIDHAETKDTFFYFF